MYRRSLGVSETPVARRKLYVGGLGHIVFTLVRLQLSCTMRTHGELWGLRTITSTRTLEPPRKVTMLFTN